MKTGVYLILILFMVLGCGKDADEVINSVFPQNQYEHKPQFYFQNAGTVKMNVFYFQESIPYTGKSAKEDINYWDITKENLKSIFQYKSFETNINVPSELNEMTSMGNTSERKWTYERMENLALDFALEDTPTTANFNVFFVPGYFVKEGEEQETVIGLNLSKTNIIFVFHDIVTIPDSLRLKIFMEQSTIVHEMGHVLGFVNNGVPLTSEHQDKENGNHTTNPDCVMYHSNEGPGKLKSFVDKYMKTKDLTMWGPEVLEDAKEFSR